MRLHAEKWKLISHSNPLCVYNSILHSALCLTLQTTIFFFVSGFLPLLSSAGTFSNVDFIRKDIIYQNVVQRTAACFSGRTEMDAEREWERGREREKREREKKRERN